jgi:signal transduction histidine kinase
VTYAAILIPSVLSRALPGAERWIDLVAWAVVALLADLLRVRLWNEFTFAMSLPVALAAAMVLDPWEASVVAFAGSIEVRELRGDVPLARSLFNRAEVGLSIFLASAVFHGFHGDPAAWPDVLGPACLAFLADASLNFGLVVMPVSRLNASRPGDVLRHATGPHPIRSIGVFACLALLAPVMALTYVSVGMWAVLSLLAPLVLAWLTYEQAQRLHSATQAIAEKNRALAVAAQRAADERRDERRVLAGELHDEVLPALFRVHLMAQVLRRDLERGQLLELDDDLPQLIAAADGAQRSIRELLGDLRRSPLGRDGLVGIVRMLVSELEASSDIGIELQVEDVGSASYVSQLVAYQVIREAATNAAKYSRGRSVRVTLRHDADFIRVSVSDDGVGFDRSSVDPKVHFGVQLMQERTEALGGTFVVDSRIGGGTTVAAAIPRNA